MTKGCLLGFDLRVEPATKIGSIDVNLWPRIDDVRFQHLLTLIGHQTGRPADELKNYINLISCIPRDWLKKKPVEALDVNLIALVSTEAHVARLTRSYPDLFSYHHCDISEADLRAAGWTLLGYDLLDCTLSTTAVAERPEIAQAQPRSSFGLLDEIGASSALVSAENSIPAHAPFFPVGVFRN